MKIWATFLTTLLIMGGCGADCRYHESVIEAGHNCLDDPSCEMSFSDHRRYERAKVTVTRHCVGERA